ncbi:MAG: hypothetical protein KDJ65_11485 [Anaerolineae bacterium]|nr:hypothetical protein [Anaerolineae bacterium]
MQTRVRQLVISLTVLFIFLLSAPVIAAPLATPPSFSKVFTPSTIGPGSVSTLIFTITNGDATPITDLAFTDNLPAGVTIADPANASTTCTDGIVTAPDGGGTITFSDASLGAFSGCTVSVDVTSSTTGTHSNISGDLTSSAGNSGTATDDLTVANDRPGFSKNFAPSSIPLGGRSTLTFLVDNSANGSPVGSLDFTDNLPTGMVVADPSDASTDCISTSAPNTALIASPGSSVIILDANGSTAGGAEVLSAGATCTVTVDVVATGTGLLDNVSNDLISDSVNSSGKASATLDVTVTPLALIKTFIDDPTPPGSNTTLVFTMTNFSRTDGATAIAFTDDLTTLDPALPDLTVSSLLSNDCGGSVSGVGGTTIGFSGGSLPTEGSCAIEVSLSVPAGATTGSYTNTTSTVTGMVGGSPVVGNMASDKLFIDPAPIFTKEFIDDPATGEGTVTLRFTIQNTNPISALTSIEFTDDIGGTGDNRAGALPGLAANGLVDAGGLDPDPLVDPCGGGSLLTIPDPNDTLPSPPFPNLPPDPTQLNFTGGNLAKAGTAGDSCTFDVVLDVPAGTPANNYVNTTSDLTATPTGTTAATDILTIVAAPSLVKEFTDDPVAPGGTVTLSFTLEHSAEAPTDATDISFTDDLNALGVAGLTVNLPPSPDPPCGAGSSLTAPGDVLTLQDGILTPGESCTFSVTLDLPALSAPGNFTNNTSGVSATVSGLAVTSAAASDVLKVAGLVFTKEFLDDPIIAGDTTTLRFTIENIHPTDDATGIGFSDNLAAVLPGVPDLTAVLPPDTDTCGGTMSGPTSLSYSGGSVTTGSTCTIELTVLVPAGTADGSYDNITGNLSATQSGGGITIDAATDVLDVDSTRLQLTKSFTDDPVKPGDTVTLEFTLTNLDVTQAASSIAFSDNLDTTLSGLTFDSLISNTCGGSVGGVGTDTLSFSGGSLAASAECTIRATLQIPTGTTVGEYTNTTSDVSGTIGGLSVTGNAASDNLIVNAVNFSKLFNGPTTATGTPILSFTLQNVATNTIQSQLVFTDSLESVISGLVATDLPKNDVCGSGSTLSGTSVVTLSNSTLSPSSSCTFSVTLQVPATTSAGTYTNTTGNLSASGLVVADPASAALTVEPPPTWTKSFSPDAIGLNLTTTLRFTIDNSASVLTATNLDFTDSLPAGLKVATPANASTTCSGGTITAVAGSGVVSYSGGTVGAGSSCTIEVNTVGTAVGSLNNITGNLTSSSGSSGTASDTLIVAPQPTFNKSFSPSTIVASNVSTLTFNINNLAVQHLQQIWILQITYPPGLSSPHQPMPVQRVLGEQ